MNTYRNTLHIQYTQTDIETYTSYLHLLSFPINIISFIFLILFSLMFSCLISAFHRLSIPTHFLSPIIFSFHFSKKQKQKKVEQKRGKGTGKNWTPKIPDEAEKKTWTKTRQKKERFGLFKIRTSVFFLFLSLFICYVFFFVWLSIYFIFYDFRNSDNLYFHIIS